MRKTALETIGALVERDPRVVFIGSDLGAGTLAGVRERHPERVFMEGIAEQHVVGFAAGLAMEGFVPYVHTIGTFLTRRALEQVIIDVALHSLPVRLIASGGGMVYAPLGPTHQSIDDFALMRAIPNMQVFAPADPLEMKTLIEWLSMDPLPAYVRVAKGGEATITGGLVGSWPSPVRIARHGKDVAIISTGALLAETIQAADFLSNEGIEATLVHVPTLTPLDKVGLLEVLKRFETLVVAEEHIPIGGLWSAIADLSVSSGILRHIDRIGLPLEFSKRYGSQRDHWEVHNLTGSGMSRAVLEIVKGEAHG